MGVARLDLLGDGVHVTKTPFELVGGENGGGAGHMIGGVDYGGRLMNGPGRGDAKRDAVLLGEWVAARQIAPDFGCGGVEIGARGAQGGLGPADQALHRIVVAHRLEALRRLAAGQIRGGVQRRARDAERGRAETHAEHHVGGELVQRAIFPQRRGVVAQCGEFFRNEEIVDRIGIGAGSPQADDVPDVVHRGARHREQDGADLRRTVFLAPLGAVGFDDTDMGA